MIYLRTFWMYLNGFLATGIIGLILLITAPFDRRRKLQNRLLHAWGKWLIAGSSTRLKINTTVKPDKDRSYILIANHESMMDIFILMAISPVPIRMVSKKEIEKVPFVSAIMKATGFVFVNREAKNSAHKALNKNLELLKENRISLMLFPEGSRYKQDVFGTFKRGAFRMAIDNDLPILPVVMKGAGHIIPPSERKVHKGTVAISILPAIETKDMTLEDRYDLQDSCYKEMLACYKGMDAEIPTLNIQKHIKKKPKK